MRRSELPVRATTTVAPVTARTMKTSTRGPTARTRRFRKNSSSTLAGRLLIAKNSAAWPQSKVGLRAMPIAPSPM